jgi:hypothetical protein
VAVPDPEQTVKLSLLQRQVTARSGRAASWLNANFSAIFAADYPARISGNALEGRIQI